MRTYLLLLIMLFLISCGKDTKQAIKGKWDLVETVEANGKSQAVEKGTLAMDFGLNDTVTMSGNHGREYKAYSVNGDTLKIYPDEHNHSDRRPLLALIEVNGDMLKVKHSNGSLLKLQKDKNAISTNDKSESSGGASSDKLLGHWKSTKGGSNTMFITSVGDNLYKITETREGLSETRVAKYSNGELKLDYETAFYNKDNGHIYAGDLEYVKEK